MLMKRICVAIVAAVIVFAGVSFAAAQQLYQLPDVKSLKHLTTKSSNAPGRQTTMDYYSDTAGNIITIHSYRGRNVAFSTHSNSDVQGTYRVFLDTTGNGLFQDIGKSQWQLPAWAR